MPDFELWDAREPTRTHGPYDGKEAAQSAADQLNKYIYDNDLGKVLGPAEVKGPYYVRPVTPGAPVRRVPIAAVFNGATDPHFENPLVLE